MVICNLYSGREPTVNVSRGGVALNWAPRWGQSVWEPRPLGGCADWRRGPGRCRAAGSTGNWSETARACRATTAHTASWRGTARACTGSKTCVFGVIAVFVYHLESLQLCCTDVTFLVSVVDGSGQMVETCIHALISFPQLNDLSLHGLYAARKIRRSSHAWRERCTHGLIGEIRRLLGLSFHGLHAARRIRGPPSVDTGALGTRRNHARDGFG